MYSAGSRRPIGPNECFETVEMIYLFPDVDLYGYLTRENQDGTPYDFCYDDDDEPDYF